MFHVSYPYYEIINAKTCSKARSCSTRRRIRSHPSVRDKCARSRNTARRIFIFSTLSRGSAHRRFDRETQLGKPCVKSIVVQFVRHGVKHGKSGRSRSRPNLHLYVIMAPVAIGLAKFEGSRHATHVEYIRPPVSAWLDVALITCRARARGDQAENQLREYSRSLSFVVNIFSCSSSLPSLSQRSFPAK